MLKPKVIILSGYGLNCEEESKFAFDVAGAKSDIVHINDLIASTKKINNYQILVFPGGFSYGDDTGSGKAFANRIKNHLWDTLEHFIDKNKLVIGICNGFQILTNLGLLPGALIFNDSARYQDRWVDLKVKSSSPWLGTIDQISLPIAHGEGKYYTDNQTLEQLKEYGQIAAVYTKGEICAMQNLEANPNGSIKNIAAVTARQGRVLGIMPHPERALFFHHLPHWPSLKEKYLREKLPLPKFGPGLQIFVNGVNYFQ